ncbi:MAG: hypothetical protein Q9212_000716 [Teloschistes hypoglaucus]
MARKLQDRLALASYKTQHGLDNLSLNLVEAHLERTLKRKRPGSSTDASSDSSSTASDQPFFSGPLASSPRTAPVFSSDDMRSTMRARNKRFSYNSTATLHDGSSANRKRNRTQSMAPPTLDTSRASWKSAHNLPQSSPGFHQHAHFPTTHAANISFASDGSTVPNTPAFGSASDDEGPTNISGSQVGSSHFRSSPPCTPPPTRSRSAFMRKGHGGGEEGAELLLHLATSPSPADQGLQQKFHLPSTPPSNIQALPSSMMTPGANGFPTMFNTPGQNFAWADFINVTPSPAQGAFGNRTPGLPKTPLAAREARRRLNLDSLGATLSTPGRDATAKDTGLGMELGGELLL